VDAGRRGAAPRIALAARGGEEASRYEAGDRVTAMSPVDEEWYPGTIDRANDDGTFVVKWDDPDGGPETNNLAAPNLKKVMVFKDYAVGDDVRARAAADSAWYAGRVSGVNSDGTFQVAWDDPGGGPETEDVYPESMKKRVVFLDYKPGDKVEASDPDDGHTYPAVVVSKNADGTFKVRWDDVADEDAAEADVSARDMKYPALPVSALEVGQKYLGTINSVREFGAFVDIGCEIEGLLHISRIMDGLVDDIHAHLEVGQEVDVWVSHLREEGKIALTMVESKIEGEARKEPQDLSRFVGLDPGSWYAGVVDRLVSFGAFVTVTLPEGASAQGLVHISQVGGGFVKTIDDALKVGDRVKVRVQSVDAGADRLSLSMKGGHRRPASAAGPGLPAFEGVSPATWCDGKVASIANFGIFVTVTTPDGSAEAQGLVPLHDIKDGFVDNVASEAEVGQAVKVRVVSVARGKMRLSMREAASV